MAQQDQHANRDLYNIGTVEGNVFIENQKLDCSPNEQDLRLLKDLRSQVENGVTSWLAQNFHHGISLNPDRELLLERKERGIKPVHKPATLLEKNTTALQVFDLPEITGKLLILGHPGSGKTTELMNLAQALLKRAKAQSNYPIPVIFDLSTWKDDRQSIQAWLIDSLSTYQESLPLRQQWVKERRILPLLDGLDELPAERQAGCVARINEYLGGANAPFYLAVCCRWKVYKFCQKALELNGAIRLKDLSNEQIITYLDVGRSELYSSISAYPKLLVLLRKPFFLSIITLAYPPGSEQKWQRFQTTREHLNHILRNYIEQMVKRVVESRTYGRRKAPTPKQTKKWLGWLARQMKQQSQTTFLIEDLQPSMLPNEVQLRYQQSIGLIFGLTAGLIFGQGIMLVVGLAFGARFGLECGLMAGVGFGLIFYRIGYASLRINPIEALKWSWSKVLKRVVIGGLVIALTGGLTAGLIVGLKYGLITGLILGATAGLTLGLFAVLFGGLMLGLSPKSVPVKRHPNQGIKRSALISVIAGLLSELLLGKLLMSGVGLIVGLVFGGLACIQHFLLRLLLHRAELFPLDYVRFFNYCNELRFVQQVGGRYSFVHKYLQDHFAAME
ncbi:MAG: NACHT domain-containing protein [Aphanocapsa sp. GSE-SYN-MK-11-07L]|nr:NACHT domain-containing protein [Aphanocapsa sp. GSE-SYN-MK-11-07L]